MNISKDAKDAVNEFFNENADKDDKISASALAELVNRDAKTVRARLRKNAERDQEQFKNANWRITKTLAAKELTHFMKRDATQTEEVEEAS
jgi:hypothetical protein